MGRIKDLLEDYYDPYGDEDYQYLEWVRNNGGEVPVPERGADEPLSENSPQTPRAITNKDNRKKNESN